MKNRYPAEKKTLTHQAMPGQDGVETLRGLVEALGILFKKVGLFRKRGQRESAQSKERIRQGEHGQSLVLVSLSMMLFVGMLGLTVDIGYGFALHRQMQTAADMAALAGARELALGNGEVQATTRMAEILESNGADPNMSTYDVLGDGVQTQVVARTEYVPFFTPIFGIESLPVNGDADAIYGQLSQLNNLLPFAVSEDLWQMDTPVNIWAGETGPGNFGWVRWAGQSQSTTLLRMNIDRPSNSQTLEIGEYVAGKTGVSFSSVRPSLQGKVGETVNVFFYDPDEVVGSGATLRYQITGFGEFTITNIRSRGINSEITGYFRETVQLNGTITTGRSLGIMGTGLTR